LNLFEIGDFEIGDFEIGDDFLPKRGYIGARTSSGIDI